MVPRRHRDGWSSATASELAACQTAMTLVAAWYRSLDGGHVVFCANDSAPNLDYLRDGEAAGGIPALASGTDAAVTRNPRQDVQRAHLHAFYAEHGGTENHESSALQGHRVVAEGHRAFSAALGSDAVRAGRDSTRLAASVRAAAQPWGGNYCSCQLGVDDPGISVRLDALASWPDSWDLYLPATPSWWTYSTDRKHKRYAVPVPPKTTVAACTYPASAAASAVLATNKSSSRSSLA